MFCIKLKDILIFMNANVPVILTDYFAINDLILLTYKYMYESQFLPVFQF